LPTETPDAGWGDPPPLPPPLPLSPPTWPPPPPEEAAPSVVASVEPLSPPEPASSVETQTSTKPPHSTNPPWWRPRTSGLWWLAATLAVLAVAILVPSIIVAAVSPGKKTPPPIANVSAPAVPVSTPTIASTPASTTAPTAAPTVAPTAQPTAVPTAAPTAKAAAPPVVGFTRTGRGDNVFTVPAPYSNEATLVIAKYTGSDNFIVQSLDSSNTMEELLVDAIGSYHGVEAMDFDGTNPPVRIEVQATGPWSLTLRDAATAPTFGTYAAGNGDEVLAYNGNSNTATFAFTGQGNFIVEQYDDTGQSANLLADEIGNYNGVVPIDSSGYIVIQADGKWSVALSSG
jgi:hypothetical protein